MKKTLRTVVASLLLLVMLFSVSVTTIFAAEDLSSQGSGSAGSLDPITPPTESTETKIDLGWISVSYDDDSLDIVWHHEFESMLETISDSPEKLEALSEMISKGIEHLVIDSLKNGMSGIPSTQDTEGGISIDLDDMEGLLKIAINGYLELDPETDDYQESVLNFFKTLISEDMTAEGSEAKGLSEYVCGLIRIAVATGQMTLEELKGKIKDGDALKALINENIDGLIDSYASAYIEAKVPYYIEEYIKELKGEKNELPQELKDFISDAAVSFAKSQTKICLNGGDPDVDKSVIESFIYTQVEKVLEDLLPEYSKMKKNPGYKFWNDSDVYASAYEFAYGKIDEYVQRAVDNYVKILCGLTPENGTVLDDALQTNSTVSSVFDTTISKELDKVVAYIEGGKTGDKPATYDVFADAVKSYFENTKITIDMLDASYADFLVSKKTEFVNKFDEQFDIEYAAIVGYIKNDKPAGEEPDNYGIFETLFNKYFEEHDTIEEIPNAILATYINLYRDDLETKFESQFETEYANILTYVTSGGTKPDSYTLFENAFNAYFYEKTFNFIDKTILGEYLDLKKGALKEQFISTKLDGIIDDIIEYVSADKTGTAPDFYAEFEEAFDAENFEYQGTPITLSMVNSTNAGAVFTNDVKSAIRSGFAAKVSEALENIVEYAKLENPTEPAPEGYGSFVTEFDTYIASNPIEFANFVGLLGDEDVENFAKSQFVVKDELDAIVAYLKETAAEPASYDVFASAFDTYIAENGITLDDINATNAGFLEEDDVVKTTIKNEINFGNEYDGIVNYIKGEADKPDIYDLFAAAFNNYFASTKISLELIPDTIPLSFLKSYVDDSDKKAELVAKFKNSIKNSENKNETYDQIKSVIGSANDIIEQISEYNLSAMVESVKSDTIVSAVKTILQNDSSYKASFISVVDSLSSDTVVTLLSELVKADGFDSDTMIGKVQDSFFDEDGNLTLDDDTYNAAFELYFGLSRNQIEKKLGTFEEIIAEEYDSALKELESGASLDFATLLEYLKEITVNGETLVTFDNGTHPDMNAVKALLKTLPTPAEIATMTNEELQNLISWEIEIVTDFSTSVPVTAKFTVNLSVGSNFSDVRRFAEAICELVQFSREDGKITLNVDLFDNVYDVLCDFATSDKMSPELRAELFGLMNLSAEELYDYVSDSNGLTFNKYKSIISAIDFEKLFENFGIDDVTNEQMVRLLCKDEEKFEETRESILSRFDSVPESLKSKTVFDLYEGNGKFSYSNSLTLSVRDVIARIEGIAPGLKDFTAIIKGAVGNRTLEADVEVNVNVPKLYKVTYVVTDPDTNETVTKTGLLPEGISTRGFFSPREEYDGKVVDRYNGYLIEKWSLTPDGEPVESIIAEDGVVLYATLEKIKTSVTVYDNNGYTVNGDVIYDENKYYVLEANLVYSQNTHTPELKYQWYKGATLLYGKTGKTLQLNGDVIDSGEYWCKITIVSDGDIKNLTTNSVSVTVTINPKPIDIDEYGLKWNYTSPFVYDGSFHNVTLNLDTLGNVNSLGLPHISLASYTNIEKINAGIYVAHANFTFVNSSDNSNYVFLNPDGTQASDGFAECVWEIKPQEIASTEGFEWSVEEGAKFTYEYGKTHSVTLTLPEKLTVESYTNDAATYAGSYTTTAKIKSNDPNYVWVGTNPTINWSIEKALFDLSNVTWSYNAEEPFVYNGEEQSVLVSEVPADIVWIYTDNVQIGAGDYVASAEPDPNNALNSQNYVFKGKVSDCEWSIGKQTIETLLELAWNYTEAFTYNGEDYTVELVLPEAFDDRIVVNYTNNSATDAGKYTAIAELVALDSDNFEVVGEENKISFACEWVINKATADVSGISFKDKTVYYTGEAFDIKIEGTLPAGISVKYSDAVSEVGKYEMTATFVYNENNFEPIAPMTATLNILPVYPIVNEFACTDSSGNVIVNIKAQHGIPSNYQLNVKDLSVQYNGYDFGNLFGYGTNGDVLSVYDIHFAENGTETPFNDVFSVRMLLPDNFNGNINNVRVVHIAENGELTDMGAMIDGDYVAFETIHFSIYAIVEVVERVEKTEEFDLYSLIPYGIALLVVIILLIIIIAVIKKKRKKNKPEEPKAKEEPKPEEPEPETEAEAEAEAEVEPETEKPLEEEKPTIVIHESVEEIQQEAPAEDGEAVLPPSDIVHVRCRSSFMSRLIQSEPPIQDYYTVLKNALLSYKGVKARMSFNFESFNSGRVQCAKLNVKGKSFLVYLGLDLAEYNVNKYHFSDASDKPKFEKVPMMLKVKSDRSLKYALELIDEVMKKNGFEKDPKFQEQDYHMPYETTAALAEKDLVKLILPQGVSLADGIKLVKMDVGALLDEAKSGYDDDED